MTRLHWWAGKGKSMEKEVIGGTLFIKTTGDSSEVAVEGTRRDILFNWTALTNQICKTLGTSPALLAVAMPHMIRDYQQHSLKYEIKMEGKAGAGL